MFESASPMIIISDLSGCKYRKLCIVSNKETMHFRVFNSGSLISMKMLEHNYMADNYEQIAFLGSSSGVQK